VALWEQPGEPDIPEALLPIGTPIPTANYPTQPVWVDTPEAQQPTETPRPNESYPPYAAWYRPVITVPLPIPAQEIIYAGEWLSSTRLQVKTRWALSSGLYWIDLGVGTPLVSIPRSTPATEQAYSLSSLFSVECGSTLRAHIKNIYSKLGVHGRAGR